MGILNITPDSFFDGGLYNTEKDIKKQVEKMLTEGAEIVDIGAYSSRPNAKHISAKEEKERLLPTLEYLVEEYPEAIFSVDTFRASIAKQAVDKGAHIINDISGGNMDDKMFETMAKLNVPYILMHMKGTPQTMQENPRYDNITANITSYFSRKVAELRALGVNDIILDPGFGFGKTLEHNFELLSNLEELDLFELPMLIGVSRKSMLYKYLDVTANESLNATSIANTIALLKGANILRVHDVKEAVEVVKIVNLA